MASKKKEELLQPEVQTQAQPAAQSTYSAEGLNSRADVEKAMANVSYRPGQQVTDAADALKQWQQNRPAGYQSSYQDKINSLLGQLLECLYGLPLNELALQEVFWPLKMKNTSYLPAGGNIASTEMQDDGFCLTGVVHDENARFLGGVSGNAGVFSTMDDLALFVQMLAAEGELPDGSRYLCPATVRLSMQNRTPGMAQGRGLGFALPWYENGYTGDLFPKETIGHTGFTGTSFSYDPTTGLYLIFLTNRVCPSREGTAIFRVRRLRHRRRGAGSSRHRRRWLHRRRPSGSQPRGKPSARLWRSGSPCRQPRRATGSRCRRSCRRGSRADIFARS